MEHRSDGARARGRGTAAARVLLVETNEDGTVGGSHRCLADLAGHMDRSRFTPVVLFYQYNRFVTALRAAGVEVHVWEDVRAAERRPGPRFGRLPRRLWRLAARVARRLAFLRRARIDLVHLNNSPHGGFEDWLPAATLARVPCVAHARMATPRYRRRVSRWLMSRYDAVIAISRYVEGAVVAAGIPRERVVQVYDGIDVPAQLGRVRRDAAGVRAELGARPDQVLVVMVAHLRDWKGQDVLLGALERLPDALRGCLRVAFVGGEHPDALEYLAALRRAAARLPGMVSFLGERDDAPDLIGAADIVVLASTVPEPFGLAVLEAMALGKPVVASRGGGPVETVTPDTGILFTPGDPGDLAAALAALAAEPERRQALGANGRRRVLDFDIERNVRGIEAVYARALGRRGLGTPEPAGPAGT